jgi:hypothetical protein
MNAAGGRRPVGVAVAGFGWMGRVHAQAYARVLVRRAVTLDAMARSAETGTWVEVADT